MADSDKTIDGFAYWIENEEKGVCYIPQNLCEKVLSLLKSQKAEIKRLQPKVAKWVTVRYLPQNKEFKRCTCCDSLCMGWDGETGVEYAYCPNCGAKIE